MKRHRDGAPQRRHQGDDDGEWITKDVVRHHPDGKLIRRKDGKPFRFKVKRKRRTA